MHQDEHGVELLTEESLVNTHNSEKPTITNAHGHSHGEPNHDSPQTAHGHSHGHSHGASDEYQHNIHFEYLRPIIAQVIKKDHQEYKHRRMLIDRDIEIL